MHDLVQVLSDCSMSLMSMHPSLLTSQSSNNLWYLGPSMAKMKGLDSDIFPVFSVDFLCNWYLFIHVLSLRAHDHKSWCVTLHTEWLCTMASMTKIFRSILNNRTFFYSKTLLHTKISYTFPNPPFECVWCFALHAYIIFVMHMYEFLKALDVYICVA